MKDPCKTCIENDLCQSLFPCKRRLGYLRWKEGVAQIRKKFRGEQPRKETTT